MGLISNLNAWSIICEEQQRGNEAMHTAAEFWASRDADL